MRVLCADVYSCRILSYSSNLRSLREREREQLPRDCKMIGNTSTRSSRISTIMVATTFLRFLRPVLLDHLLGEESTLSDHLVAPFALCDRGRK